MKQVVTLGGGTGSYTVLSGIKHIADIDLSAIVAMTDDGSSTGILRDELGVLPPGDVRQCLVALSDESTVLRSLLTYRFEEGGLSGHSFGNLFLAALEKVTGNFTRAVREASKILGTRGTVIPVLAGSGVLHAELVDGTKLVGEHQINTSNIQDNTVTKLEIVGAALNPDAERALYEADYIIICPGNHFCSVLPVLKVAGIEETLKYSHAPIIYIANLTNKKGHTLHWKLSQYVEEIEAALGKSLSYILVNSERIPEERLKAYTIVEGDGVLVHNDMEHDPRCLAAPLLSHVVPVYRKSDAGAHLRAFIRHDPERLREVIEGLVKWVSKIGGHVNEG